MRAATLEIRRRLRHDDWRPLENAKSTTLIEAAREASRARDWRVLGAIQREWVERGRELGA